MRAMPEAAVRHGEKAMSELCAHVDVDTVMSAIVGAAGLLWIKMTPKNLKPG